MTFTVGPAHPQDVPAIIEIVRAAYLPYVERIGREPAPMTADHATAVAQGRTTVARRDGHVVGVVETETFRDHLLIENIAVATAVRGLGVGALLLAAAEQQAAAAGLTRVELYTHETMVENIAYYPRRGYVLTDRRTENGFARAYFAKNLT